MDLQHVTLQFKRLQKHHESSLAEKDPVALLDLAHSLRIFTEMKRVVDSIFTELNFPPDFSITVKNKQLSELLSGNRYFSVPISSHVESPDMQMKGLMVFPDKALTPEEVKKLYEAGPPVSRVTTFSFTDWLGASIIERVNPENKEQPKESISREILIKRVANMLGASHPAGMENGSDLENRYDTYIRGLDDIKVAGGYSLTYYQLLEISSEMVRVFSRVFK